MKKNKKTLTLIGIVITLLLLIVMLFGYYYYSLLQYKKNIGNNIDNNVEEFEKDNIDGDDLSDSEVEVIDKELAKNLEIIAKSEMNNEDILNIMLIGVDSRFNNFNGRSDVMMLMSINKRKKNVVIASFLRDTYVDIEGFNNNKLNAAYAFGGTDLLKDTFKRNFGITIDKCVVVNFFIVMDVVDAVGGVDIDLSYEELNYINNSMREICNLTNQNVNDFKLYDDAGVIHLNGLQALTHSRNRKIGSDFARTDRQRDVLMHCYEKIKDLDLIELSKFAEEFLPKVATDLTYSDCLYLLSLMLNIKDYDINSYHLPIDDAYEFASINGMSVVVIDFEKNIEYWKDSVYN